LGCSLDFPYRGNKTNRNIIVEELTPTSKCLKNDNSKGCRFFYVQEFLSSSDAAGGCGERILYEMGIRKKISNFQKFTKKFL